MATGCWMVAGCLTVTGWSGWATGWGCSMARDWEAELANQTPSGVTCAHDWVLRQERWLMARLTQ